MTSALISAGTRNEFREALSSYVLREIGDIFAVGDFEPRLDYDPQVMGQRRTLVEQYLSGIDLSKPTDVQRLLLVFEELIFRLEKDSYDKEQSEKTVAKLLGRMQRDGFQFASGRFSSGKLTSFAITTPHLIDLTEDSISEQIEKARQKIEHDPAGAITNAYTLIEDLLKAILRKADIPHKETEGDIRALYALAAAHLNLSPKGESLESYLKAILQGLTSQIAGLYDLANKASDRHARKYNPRRHHAQLAVNVAFTLCEFLLASFEYQRTLKEKKRTDEQTSAS